MPEPRLIVFVGPVGSGKSTHIKLLYSKLKRRGLKVRVGSLKTGHMLAFILEAFLAKIVAGERRDVFPTRALVEEKPRLFKSLFGLWLGLDLINVTMRFLAGRYS